MAKIEIKNMEPQESMSIGQEEQLSESIRKRAYEIFEQRGCKVGFALEDWLCAERELFGEDCCHEQTEAAAA